MITAHFPDDASVRWHQPVMALGNFDGLHRGHMKIIDRVRRRAGERGGTPAAMTFDPHPSRVLRPDKAPPLLMTTAQKLEALGRAGMQGVAVVRFTHELSSWDPERFVRTVLVEWLHVAEVWVGANFLFGHDRAGTFSVLRSSAPATAFAPRRSIRSATRTSSSAARGCGGSCPRGASTRRRRCSGTISSSTASVTRGAGRGRELGFPTANVCTENELVPPSGVYATLVTIDGVVHPSITNIGFRPTFGDVDRQVIETHLFDVDRDLYDAPLRLSFVQRLRDERAFPDVDALRAQIDADCRVAQRLFGHISL